VHVTGMPALFFLVPFLIGCVVCLLAGVVATVWLACVTADWVVDRVIVRFYVYSDFIQLVRTNAIKKRDQQK
jgi:hypothetical protein